MALPIVECIFFRLSICFCLWFLSYWMYLFCCN